jgi:transposase-like protein
MTEMSMHWSSCLKSARWRRCAGRSAERVNFRNGYRERPLETRLGTVELKVPKLRQSSYFPGFLEPRRMSEQALTAVVQEAYVQKISTRRVDELVQAMGMTVISKSRPRGCTRRSMSASSPFWAVYWRDVNPIFGSIPPTLRAASMAR